MPRRSILICDDEVELAAELGEYLEAQGWTVQVAVTALEAMAMLRDGKKLDCFVTDIRLGNFDGAELIAVARGLPLERQPTVIGVITGHLEDGIEAADIAADVLHIKPIDPDALAEDLAGLIDSRADSHAAPTP